MNFLSSLIPQSESAIDGVISTELKLVTSAAATWIGAKLMAVPAAVAVANMFGLDQVKINSYAEMGSALAIAWMCAWIHKHFYNGNPVTNPTSIVVPPSVAPASGAMSNAPAVAQTQQK